MTTGRVIAIVGAESTGKSMLARAVADALNARGERSMLVAEYLREWCEREGRVPHAAEQHAIAEEQTRRIAAAATGQETVVADTTALMTAIYSDLLFGDTALYADALAAQRTYALTLVTALDLPWVADGLQRDGPHVREPVDTLLRVALARGRIGYCVVQGSRDGRLRNALNAMDSIAVCASAPGVSGQFGSERAMRPRHCERCSEPDCEHRLFSALKGMRRA